MKLTLSKIKTPDRYLFGSLASVLVEYLGIKDIYVGEANKDFVVEYNDFYHTYEIQVFDIAGNYRNPKEHQVDFENWLIKHKYKYDKDFTWRWEGKKEVKGIRFSVKAK